MASEEQIIRMLKRLAQVHPFECFKDVNEAKAGIGAVLRLLYETNEPMSAGAISKRLGISTARVAVLLKKMEQKGMITKQASSKDARVTIVQLTEFGKATIEKMKENVFAQMGRILDQIGEERLLEFFDTTEEIKNIVQQPKES